MGLDLVFWSHQRDPVAQNLKKNGVSTPTALPVIPADPVDGTINVGADPAPPS